MLGSTPLMARAVKYDDIRLAKYATGLWCVILPAYIDTATNFYILS
jgi:hypothetical protein